MCGRTAVIHTITSHKDCEVLVSPYATGKPISATKRRRLNRQGTRHSVTEAELRKRLEHLRVEHRDLDAAIAALTEAGSTDQLQIARLKKRKLALRDQIALIEDQLIPDIIA